MKKGVMYKRQDPAELIEEGEGYDVYRSLRLNDEIDAYVFDGHPESAKNGVSFDTRQSLEEVCMRFYMLGLERKFELHPHIYVPIAKVSDKVLEKGQALALEYAGKQCGPVYNAYKAGYEDCFNEVSLTR